MGVCLQREAGGQQRADVGAVGGVGRGWEAACSGRRCSGGASRMDRHGSRGAARPLAAWRHRPATCPGPKPHLHVALQSAHRKHSGAQHGTRAIGAGISHVCYRAPGVHLQAQGRREGEGGEPGGGWAGSVHEPACWGQAGATISERWVWPVLCMCACPGLGHASSEQPAPPPAPAAPHPRVKHLAV